MNKEYLIDQLSKLIESDFKNESIENFEVLSRQELIDLGGEDPEDPLYGDNYSFVIIYKDHPNYMVLPMRKIRAINFTVRFTKWYNEDLFNPIYS